MSAEHTENAGIPKTIQKPKTPKARTRSSSVHASEVSEGRKTGELPYTRSRSVAPSMSRKSTTTSVPTDTRSQRGAASTRQGSTHSRTTSRIRSSSTSHLPLPTSTPSLSAAASHLHLDIPASRSVAQSNGLPSPPPEYTEIAPGMFEESPSAPPTIRSQGQMIRTSQPQSRPPSTRSASSRPTFRRALSSNSTVTVEAMQPARTPQIPPALPGKEMLEGHKLEFAGKW
ncbi:hypothetical protein ABW20_dc0107976 [Dactylellina cionopaga]|nr:hypothetical protein ABW20_dc0107976 [Dactylellina cionopaga]